MLLTETLPLHTEYDEQSVRETVDEPRGARWLLLLSENRLEERHADMLAGFCTENQGKYFVCFLSSIKFANRLFT